jgi:hypothetical protein
VGDFAAFSENSCLLEEAGGNREQVNGRWAAEEEKIEKKKNFKRGNING